MPIYEFTCGGCGHEFEELVMSRDKEVACPACASSEINKRMSVCAVKSGTKFTSTSQGSGCGTCASKQCGTCH